MSYERKANDSFFDYLRENGIHVTREQQKNINERLQNILNYEPRIGIFGKTGVGKSSLCNALFGTDICQISDVEACTRNVQEVLLNMGGGKRGIKLIDVPGVGESAERDQEYEKLYAKLLPELDLVLWLIKADDRALSSDERFYKRIVKPHIEEGKAFFFVLNQVDKIEPFREWDEDKHEPGERQFKNMHKKITDLSIYFDVASSKIIPVSANEKYNLTKLVDEFIRALPPERQLTTFRAVNDEYQSEQTGYVAKNGFLESVIDTVMQTVVKIDDAVESIKDIITPAKDFIFDHIPFIGGGGGCYITSAVCNHEHKGDNCYELTMFRDFRDNWLAKQKDGSQLITHYYRIAPTIVNLIEKEKNSSDIYKKIECDYLLPCLKYLEHDELEECKKHYVAMVENLSGKYLLWD